MLEVQEYEHAPKLFIIRELCTYVEASQALLNASYSG